MLPSSPSVLCAGNPEGFLLAESRFAKKASLHHMMGSRSCAMSSVWSGPASGRPREKEPHACIVRSLGTHFSAIRPTVSVSTIVASHYLTTKYDDWSPCGTDSEYWFLSRSLFEPPHTSFTQTEYSLSWTPLDTSLFPLGTVR